MSGRTAAVTYGNCQLMVIPGRIKAPRYYGEKENEYGFCFIRTEKCGRNSNNQ